MHPTIIAVLLILGLFVPAPTLADDPQLTVERIFGDEEFETESFGPYEWLDDGDSYTAIESLNSSVNETAGSAEEASEPPAQLVRYDTRSGKAHILVTDEQMTPPGHDKPLDVDDYDWSEDKSQLLLFVNTVKVWRQNTRGDYWVLDLEQKQLRQVSPSAEESTLMFAKFSPDGDRVAYVRDHNLYVEQLDSGETTALTTDGTDQVINGTFDWVYEEEFDLRDGFRWSPDGQRIAYWQLDANGIRDFYLINNTDDLYPQLIPLPYPKVGTTNSACRIGVIDVRGGDTTWMNVPGDPRENYLVSLEWIADGSGVLIEQLNRLQNHRILWQADADMGEVRSIFEDRDEAWVDMRSKFEWYKSSTHRLILSERDGWRHAYRVRLSDGATQLLTPGDYDVVDLVGMDAVGDDSPGWLYFTASPDSAVRQYLYRVPIDGGSAQRVTPEAATGFHTYEVAPNGRWAVHTFSALGHVPATDLVTLPDHRSARWLEENRELRKKLASVRRGAHEFFQVTIAPPDAAQPLKLDGWLIKPPDFDSSKKYPILFYVYTEPWGQTARDVWGKERYLWHVMLSQRGYIVATVDNRGTPAPRGRAWRKAIYRKIGRLNVQDQAAATRQILAWPFVDEDRVGVWGWSGGGSMTLNAMFQHPDLYHVGMSVAPVGDQRLYDTIYQERYMGLPDDNEVGYTEGSPVTHAKNLQGKLLLVHGTGDDNVHYQNAEVIMNALIEHKRPFDMMAYPNRAHAIKQGDGTREHLFQLLTRYLTTHLQPGGRQP